MLKQDQQGWDLACSRRSNRTEPNNHMLVPPGTEYDVLLGTTCGVSWPLAALFCASSSHGRHQQKDSSIHRDSDVSTVASSEYPTSGGPSFLLAVPAPFLPDKIRPAPFSRARASPSFPGRGCSCLQMGRLVGPCVPYGDQGGLPKFSPLHTVDNRRPLTPSGSPCRTVKVNKPPLDVLGLASIVGGPDGKVSSRGP